MGGAPPEIERSGRDVRPLVRGRDTDAHLGGGAATPGVHRSGDDVVGILRWLDVSWGRLPPRLYGVVDGDAGGGHRTPPRASSAGSRPLRRLQPERSGVRNLAPQALRPPPARKYRALFLRLARPPHARRILGAVEHRTAPRQRA